MNERQVQHTKGLQSASGYEPCDFPDNLRHLSDPLSKAYGRQIEKERSGSQRVTDSPNASALYEPHATFLRCRQALEKILEQHRTLNQLPGVRHGARVPPSIHRNASSAQMDLTDTIGSSLVGGGSMDVSSLPLPGKQLQVMAGVFGEESLQGYIRAISLLLDPRLNTSEGAVQLFSRLIADNQTSDEEDEQETPVVSSTHLAAPPSSPVSNEQARNNSGGEPKTSAELPTLQRVVGGFGRKPEKKESVVQASKTEQDFQRSGSGEMPTSSASAAATAAAVAALLSWKKAQSLRRISPDCDGSEKKNQFFESYAAHTQELLSRQRQQGRDKVGEAVSFTNACKQPVLRHTKQEKNLPQSALPRGVLLDAARVLLATSAQHSNNGGEALPLHQALVHLLLPKGNDRDGKKKDNEDMLDRLNHLHETHRQGPLPPENVSIEALRAKRSSSWNHSGFELRDKKSNSPLAYDNSSKKFSHSSPDHRTEGGRNANSREPSWLQPKDTPTDLDAHLTSHSVAATVNASDDEMIEATAAALKAIGRLLTLRASRRLPERQPSALLLPVNSPSKTYTADEACTGTQAIAPGSAVQKVTADLPVARNLSSHIRHILSTYVTSQKDAGVLSAALAAALRRDGPPSSDRVQALEVADAGCESGLPQYVDTHRPSRKRVQQPDEKTRESGRQECGVVFSTREKLEGGPTVVLPGKHVQSVSYGVPALHTGHIEAAESFTPQRLRLFQQLARLHGLPQINGRPGASFGEEENKLSVGKKGIVPQEKGQLSCNTARMSSSSPVPPLLSSDPEASSEASAEIHVCPAPPPSPAHAGLRVPKGPLQTAALPCSKGGQEQQRREDAHVIPGASRADCQGTGNTLWQQIPHRSSNSAAASSFATDQGVLQLLLQAHESLQRSLASNALKNKTDTRFLERRDFVLGKKKAHDHANRHHPDSSTQLTTSQRDAMNLLGFSSSRTQLEAEMLGGQPFNGPGGTTGATNQSDQQYGLHTQRQGSDENNQAQNQQIATKRSKPLNPYATPFVPRFALASSLSEEASSNSLTSADAATSGSRWGADITPVSSSPGPVPVATDASSFSVGRGKSQRFEVAGQFPLPSGSEKNPDILAALGAERGGSDSCESQKAVLENALHEILLQRRVASRRTDRSHRLCKLPVILQEDSQALLAVLRKQLAQTRDSEYGIRTLQLNHASQPSLSQQLSETLAVKREQQRRGSDNVCTHGREREAHEDAWPQESFVSLVNKQLLRADEKLLPDASLPQTVVPKVTLAQKRQNLQASVSSHHLLCTPPHTASGVHGEDASFLQSAAKRQPFRGGSQLHLSGLAVPDADLVTAESTREVTEKGKERVAVRKAAVQQGGEAEAGDFGSSVRNTNRPETNTGYLSSALSKEHLTLLQLQHRMHALQLQSHQTRASSSANLERHPHSSPLPPQVDCPSSFGRQTRHPSLHSNNAPVAGEARLSQATLTAIHLNDSSSIDSIPPCPLVRSLPTRSSKNAAATGHSILLQEASRQKGAQRDAGVNPESLSTPPMRLPELHTHSSSDSYSVGNTAAAPVALTQAAPENARNEQATGRDSSAIDRKYHGGSSRIVLSQVDVNMKEPGRQEEVFGSHVPDTKGRILGPKKGDENSLSPTQQTHLLQTTLLALSRGGSSLSPALLAALGAAAASPETLLGHLRRLAAAEVKMPSRSEKVLGQVDPFRSVSSTSENTGEPSNEYSLPRSAPSRISEVHQGDDVAGERLPSPSQNLHLSQKGIYSKNQLLKLSRCLLQQQERKKKARTKAESSSGSGDDSADEETNMVRQSLPFVERFALPGETAPAGHAVRGLARGPLSPGMHAGPRILPAGRSKASAAPQGNKVASRVPPLLSNIFPLNAVKDELQTGGTVKVAVAPEGQAHSLSETGEKPAGTSTGTLSFASPSGATCGSSRPSSAASLLATVEGATRDAPDETANIRNTEGVEGKGSDAKPASHSSLRLPRRRGSVPTRDKGNDQKSSGVDGGIAGKHGVEGGNPSKRRGSTAFLVSVGSGKHASTTSASPCGPATKGLEPRLPKHVFAEDSERNTKAQTQKKTGEEDMPAAGEAVAKDSQSKQQTNAGMATQPRQGGGGKSRVGKRGSHTQRSNSSSFQDGHQPLSTRSKESSEKNDVSEAPDSSACPGSLADSQALQSASKNSPGADKGPEVGTMGCLQRQKKTQTAVETRANVEDQGLPEESENHTEEENLHKKVQHGAPQSHLVANYSASVDRHPLEEKEVVRDRSVASVSSCVCSSSETGKLEAIKPQTTNPTASTGPKHHRKKKDTLGKPGQGLGGSVISKTRSHSDSKDTYKRSSMAGEAVLSVAGEARFSAVHRETRITSASSSSSDEICEMTKETKRNKEETEASATCVK
uniref:Uncharacterized protein n=1 Tax=Toxoplasma gondii COUG TaxID=1074873 RepID=A0A2G8Y1C6_TOXGO|nr:hypothetical protein TGCOUG_269350 [Toxoplasma gondii COUG]